MGRKHKFYGREPSDKLGGKFREWRLEVHFTLEQAATRLGLKGKSPGAYLCQMEKGWRTIPEMVLMNAANVYKVPIAEILRQAYPQQLHLPILLEVIKPTALPKDIEDYLQEIEKELEKEEKKELANFAGYLLLQRKFNETGESLNSS